MRHVLVRGSAIVGFAAAAVFAFAGPAAAHVTINPTSATQGGDATITFRVPNEEDASTTVKLEVDISPDTPIAGVDTRPIPGWTAKTEMSKLAKPITTDSGQVTQAVTKITWTANTAAAAIQPGQFQEFDLSLDTLPAAKQVVFKALQTYANGDIVRWIDAPNPDGTEPAHPAPVLTLVADSGATPTAPASGGGTGAAAPASTSGSSGGSTGTVLGIIAIVLAAGALALGYLNYRARQLGAK
jgi:uncharacterized protein YcnI